MSEIDGRTREGEQTGVSESMEAPGSADIDGHAREGSGRVSGSERVNRTSPELKTRHVKTCRVFCFWRSLGSAPVSGAGFRVPRKRTLNRGRLFRPTSSKSRLSLRSRQTLIPVVRQWTARRQRIVWKICLPTAAFFLASVVFEENGDVFISTTADWTRMPGAAKLR
jgi:hypothetical protein